jgi:hypothetical protein
VRRKDGGFILLAAVIAALFAVTAVEALRVRATQALEQSRRRGRIEFALREARDRVREAAAKKPPAGRLEGEGGEGGVARRVSAAWDGRVLSDWREE